MARIYYKGKLLINGDVCTSTQNGAMSSTDKIKLDGIAEGANKGLSIPTGGKEGSYLVYDSVTGEAKWDDKFTNGKAGAYLVYDETTGEAKWEEKIIISETDPTVPLLEGQIYIVC